MEAGGRADLGRGHPCHRQSGGQFRRAAERDDGDVHRGQGRDFRALVPGKGTLSIQSIKTTRPEAWYWLAILFTFALGTAAGDLVAEKFGLGYLSTGILFGLIVGSLTLGYRVFGMDAILGFWLVHILTRTLGASFGDLLSQDNAYGGFGFGTVITSALFLGAIIAIVACMTFTHDGHEAAV